MFSDIRYSSCTFNYNSKCYKFYLGYLQLQQFKNINLIIFNRFIYLVIS